MGKKIYTTYVDVVLRCGTTHALRAYYPGSKQGKWVIVQEVQNEHTLTCFWPALR